SHLGFLTPALKPEGVVCMAFRLVLFGCVNTGSGNIGIGNTGSGNVGFFNSRSEERRGGKECHGEWGGGGGGER
ncbi:pentapeptide repeat-containing protein, partial [Mycobacterium kansasii]